MSTEVDIFLAHYGKKGMKWGVINEDDDSVGSSKSSTSTAKPSAEAVDATAQKIGKRRLALQAKYLNEGHSQEEAERRADKRIKAEKILAVAGVVAVASAGAYVGQKEYGKRFSEVVLREGTELRYINALGPKADYNRRLYTTFNEGDTKKYRGMLAKQLQSNQAGSQIYETVLTATQDIKAPSHKQAEKIYNELLKNGSLSGGFTRQSYVEFNRALVNTKGDRGDSGRFYDELKKRGYNAVLDSNDQFVSGYNTKHPLILFNAASSTVKTGESVVNQKTIDGLYNRQMAAVVAKSFAPTAAIGAAAIGAHRYVTSKSKYALVNKYMEEHPNTDRTPAEIYASIKLGPDGKYTVANQSTKKGGTK